MTDPNKPLSRRTFLKATSALALTTVAGFPEAARAQESDTAALSNAVIEAQFDAHGLTAIHDLALSRTFPFTNDGFSLALDTMTVDSSALPAPTRTQNNTTVTYRYTGGPQTVTVVYELRPGCRFVSKQVSVAVTDPAPFRVKALTPLRVLLGSRVSNEVTSHGGSYGAFLRLADPPESGLFFVVQNPFMQWQRAGQQVSISYAPDMAWQSSYGPFVTDRVCVGPYALSGHGFPTALVPEWHYSPDPARADAAAPVRDLAEWQALTDCVRAFLLVPAPRSARIHVGWCENDYQIDVATPPGQAEYGRIMDQAAALGLRDILYAPTNSLLASRAQSTDAWQWEYVTWLGLGEQIRTGKWDPDGGIVPKSITTMRDAAAKRGVALVAYVYPSLKWNPQWDAGSGPYGGADSANREFQDWLIQKLTDFQAATGIGGYSFDYWWLNYTQSSPYAQWNGCRWILETLRTRLPNILIDGRQSYQNYGPWTWLAGTYPHPTTGDEQPESFRAFPDLHIDRVYGNRQRWAAWWYRMENFCPTEILPGFITHQTQRLDAQGQFVPLGDFRVRDWDYLGWRYSLISSLATAPMNHVVNMIPARDPSEFAHFSRADQQWLREWLDWTDKNRETLRHVRPIIGQPRVGCVDGTAAIVGDQGFVFLFNPNARAMPAEFVLDASIGLTQGQSFTVRSLYPRADLTFGNPEGGVWRYGDAVTLPMEGASALVLEITPGQADASALLNAAGTMRRDGDHVVIADAQGPIGHTINLQALAGTRAVKSVTVNGVPVPFTQAGVTVTAPVRFAGQRFDQCQSIGNYEPAFTGGAWSGTFTIPARVFAQLRRRQLAWPIPYTADDLKATWLGPSRLLLYVQIADPEDAMAVTMTLDGQDAALQKAYTSIYPQAVDRTFVGWYFDVSSLTPDTPHTLTLALPALQPGQFQGVFFENVETELTSAVAAA